MSTSAHGGFSADGSLPRTKSRRDGVLVPKRVIRFNGEQATFCPDALEKELEEIGAVHDQLYVISVTGLCRSGKSFLINLMIHYLNYYCQHGTDDGWEKSPHPITGVKWARGQKQSVTQGIWMLLYPKLVDDKRLVFMDCQGTGDNDQHTPTLDKMIMFYSLKLSDLTIINIRGNIELRDLDTLGVCLLTKQGKQLPTGFKDLRFLIRDWTDDDEEPMPLTEIAANTQSSDVKMAVNAILKSCRTVQSAGLPHPGRRVSKGSSTDGITLTDVDEDFVAACKKYFKTVLIEEPSKSTTVKKGRNFLLEFELLGGDTVEKSTSLMEACVTSLVNDAYSDALSLLEARGLSIHENHFNTEQEMRQAAAEALAEVVQKYQQDPRVVEHADERTKREDPEGLRKITNDFVERGAYQLRSRERSKQLSATREEEANIQRKMQQVNAELEESRERCAELEEKQKNEDERSRDHEMEELRRQNAERDQKIAQLERLQKYKGLAEKKKQSLINEKDNDTESEVQREMTIGKKFLNGWKCVGSGLVDAAAGVCKVASAAKDAVVYGVNAAGDAASEVFEAAKEKCSIS